MQIVCVCIYMYIQVLYSYLSFKCSIPLSRLRCTRWNRHAASTLKSNAATWLHTPPRLWNSYTHMKFSITALHACHVYSPCHAFAMCRPHHGILFTQHHPGFMGIFSCFLARIYLSFEYTKLARWDSIIVYSFNLTVVEIIVCLK